VTDSMSSEKKARRGTIPNKIWSMTAPGRQPKIEVDEDVDGESIAENIRDVRFQRVSD